MLLHDRLSNPFGFLWWSLIFEIFRCTLFIEYFVLSSKIFLPWRGNAGLHYQRLLVNLPSSTGMLRTGDVPKCIPNNSSHGLGGECFSYIRSELLLSPLGGRRKLDRIIGGEARHTSTIEYPFSKDHRHRRDTRWDSEGVCGMWCLRSLCNQCIQCND